MTHTIFMFQPPFSCLLSLVMWYSMTLMTLKWFGTTSRQLVITPVKPMVAFSLPQSYSCSFKISPSTASTEWYRLMNRASCVRAESGWYWIIDVWAGPVNCLVLGHWPPSERLTAFNTCHFLLSLESRHSIIPGDCSSGDGVRFPCPLHLGKGGRHGGTGWRNVIRANCLCDQWHGPSQAGEG